MAPHSWEASGPRKRASDGSCHGGCSRDAVEIARCLMSWLVKGSNNNVQHSSALRSASQTSQTDASTAPHLPMLSLKTKSSSQGSQCQNPVQSCAAFLSIFCQPWQWGHWPMSGWGSGSPIASGSSAPLVFPFLAQGQWAQAGKQHEQGGNGKDKTLQDIRQYNAVLYETWLLLL